MKNIFTDFLWVVFILFSIAFNTKAQVNRYKFDFSTNIDDTVYEQAILPSSVITDQSGNIYVGGNFYHSHVTIAGFTLYNHNPDVQNNDFFILKAAPDGKILWVKNGDDNVYGDLRKMCMDQAGNIYLAGNFRRNAADSARIPWIKITPDENQLPVACSLVNSVDPYGIAASEQGDVYVYGYFTGDSLSFGNIRLKNPGVPDKGNIFIAAFDNKAEATWIRILPSSTSAKSHFYAPFSYILVDKNSGIYISDDMNSDSMYFDSLMISREGAWPRFVAKLNSDGSAAWAKTYGYNFVFGLGFMSDENGNIYLAGNFCDTAISFDSVYLKKEISKENQVYVFKISPDGRILWGRSSNSDRFCAMNMVWMDSGNRLHFTGNYTGNYFLLGGSRFDSTSIKGKFFLLSMNKEGDAGLINDFALGNVFAITGGDDDKFYAVSSWGYDSVSGHFKNGLFLNKFSFNTSSVPLITESKIPVYPNPSSDGIFYIKKEGRFSGLTSVEVFDYSGRSVLYRKISPAESTLKIDLFDQQDGLYFIRLYNHNERVSIIKIAIAR